MPIWVVSTSVSAILQTPRNTACRSWHSVLVLFQNPAWQAQTNTAVSLWVSRAKYQCRLQSSSWPFCSDSPEWCSRHMVTWFGCHGNTFGTTENAIFSCIYNPQITVSPTSSFSASFNGNRIKNHPEPWTCPLREVWRTTVYITAMYNLYDLYIFKNIHLFSVNTGNSSYGHKQNKQT